MNYANEAYKLINKGYALFDAKIYDEAIECYDQALEIDRNEVESRAWVDIGNDLFAIGEYDQAIKFYDKAAKSDPQDAWAWRNKGLALQNLGKYDKAIECFDKAINIDGDFVDSWIDRGNTFLMLGNYNEAITCFDQAIEIDPNSVVVWASKGNALFDLGEYDEAVACYDWVLEMEPENILAWSYKGHALEKLGNHEEAVKNHQKAIEYSKELMKFEPDDPDLWIIRGSSLEAMGDYRGAKRCYKKAVDLEPYNTDALRRLGLIYADYTYERDRALEISRRMLEINPGFLEKANIAEDLIVVGNYEEGRKYASEVLNETKDVAYQCGIRFLIFASYLLEDKVEKFKEGFAKFLDYYSTLNDDFKIEEDQWVFRGLIHAIDKSNADLEAKFLLTAVIDLMQGNIDRRRLSFFRATD